MNPQRTLTTYVIAVLVVMAVVIGIRWLTGGYGSALKVMIFFAGFVCGMIAMYLAMHLYRDNVWPWFSKRLKAFQMPPN